jgi:serine/threonine protein kinase
MLSLLSTVFELNLLASIYEGVVAGTMGDLMKGKHLKWKDTSMASVAEGVAEGMNHVHSKGRPHGFLNPECVVFGMGLGVKVRDAFAADAWTEGRGYLFTSHCNTLCYLSPSRIKGEEATLEDDIYGFGMILYSSAIGGDAFQTLIKSIREEQMFPGIPDNVLAGKLQKKIATGNLKLEFGRVCPNSVKKLVGDCTGPMGSRPGFGAIIKRLRGEVRREVSAPYKRSGLAAGPTRSAEGQGSSKAASEGKAASEVRQPTAPGAGAKEKADATAAPADAPAAAGGLASPTKQNLQDTEVEDIVSSDSESDGSSSDSDSDVAL